MSVSQNAALVEAIEETRQKLNLKSFVCSFHEKAENALADHSINLTRQLANLSGDYKCAAELMQESASQSNTNRLLTMGLKTGVLEHLSALKASLSELVNSGSGAFETFDNELNTFEARWQMEDSQILGCLQQMGTISTQLKECSDQSLDTILQTANDGVEKVKRFAEHHLKQAKQDVQASLGRLNTVESSLAAATENIKADLDGFLNRHATMLKGQVESSNTIKQKVAGMKRSAANAFAGMKEQEEQDVQAFCHKSQEMKEEFSKRIDGLVEEFVHSKRKKVEECDTHNGQIKQAGEDILGLLEVLLILDSITILPCLRLELLGLFC